MNEETENIIATIKQQIAALHHQHVALSTENASLRKAKLQLEFDIEKQQNTIEQLNNQLQLIKITKFAANDNEIERIELKQTINEYIKEIDNCIKLLNR
jgi:chromosome segregation ATPase